MQVSSGRPHMLASNQRGRGHDPVTVLGRMTSFVTVKAMCALAPRYYTAVMRTAAIAVVGASLALVGCAAKGPPFSAADSISTMQLERGFHIELVAAEPDIVSPVAMDIDENGRIFVVEMAGYPLDTPPAGA